MQQAWKEEGPLVLFQHVKQSEQGEKSFLTSIFFSQERQNLMF